MTTPPKYIRVHGQLYKLATDGHKKHRLRRPLNKLLEHWLDSGWRNTIYKHYSSWDKKELANKIADEFGVYLGDLVHDKEIFNWLDEITRIRTLSQ